MSRRTLFDSPTVARLQTIIDSIREGDLLFPEFLRPFVWRDEQRLRLLDSILKGLPIGSFLVWRTHDASLRCQTKLGPVDLPRPPAASERNYVLDGVQRLTTLYVALVGLTSPSKDEDGPRWPVYFDLERDLNEGGEDRFRAPPTRGEPSLTWLPLAALFDGKLRWNFQQHLHGIGRDDLANKVEHLDRIFKDYLITIVPIVTDDLELATTSFQRINSEGTPMGMPEMLRALTYRPGFDLETIFAEITERLAWPTLSQELLVRTLAAIRGLDIQRTSLPELATAIDDRALFERLEHALVASLSFLDRRCRILSQEALPYSTQLVALAYASSRGFDLALDEVAAGLETWLWATAYTGYFSRRSGASLRQALDHVLGVCGGAAPLPDDLPRSCPPTTHFRVGAVRSVILMHLLARRAIVDDRGAPVDGPRLVSRGSESSAKLFLAAPASDPANRVLVDPLDAASLRQALTSHMHPYSAQLRDAHLLPPWSDPRAADRDYVLSWRRERLRELEADDLARLGLQLEEAPSEA